MRKLTVLFIILWSVAGVLQAQKGTAVENIGKAMTKSFGKGSAGAMVKTPKGTRNLPVTGRVRAGSVVAPAQGNTQSRALTNPQTAQTDATTLVPQAHTGVAKVGVLSSKEGQAAILDKAKQQAERVEELVTALEKKQELRNKWLNEIFQTGIGKSVLFAPFEADTSNGFSVTVFKTNYQGMEEIFGVMASHALASNPAMLSSSIKKNFQVEVKLADGTTQLVSAQVVQSAPQSMLDLSLVKFDKQAENLLVPLELANTSLETEKVFASIGYKQGRAVVVDRIVKDFSFLSIRTNNPIEGNQNGFCGSPLLTDNNRIAAIHTGYVGDISYGAQVQHIQTLLNAYHNAGNATYFLTINGQNLAQLDVDEYITSISLYDTENKRLFLHNYNDKFSQSVLTNALKENPQAQYLLINTRKAQWVQRNGTDYLVEDRRNKKDPTKRQHRYNLRTKQIEPTRPAVIKM